MARDEARTERLQRLQRVGEAASRFAAVLQLGTHARGRRAGLSLQSVDATVLGLLRVHGPSTPRDLARRAGIGSSGTITGAIDRLERAGWTDRTPCRVDRRQVFITLTDAAREDVDLVAVLARYDDDQLAAIGAFLDDVGRSADEAGDGVRVRGAGGA